MSERGAFRGRGGRGGGGYGSRGGRGGNQQHGQSESQGSGQRYEKTERERPKKENILNLAKYMDQKVRVKFSGGREVIGSIKGYDQLMNLVLDEVREVMRDDEGNEDTRGLGLIVARGTLLVSISPEDGSEVIENPFVAQAEGE